jgi:enolase
MFTIEKLSALEILDSRGRPTVKTRCRLASGAEAAASVPSGASTGTSEALELRDGEPNRFRGLGCLRAVANVNQRLQAALAGRAFDTQAVLDQALLALDGTENKSSLGANAMLSVSIAFARAGAAQRGVPLYQHFADLAGLRPSTLPRLTINLFSGGKHAGKQCPIQDVLVVPVTARTISDGLDVTYQIYQSAAALVLRKYGMRVLRADEGGLAPPFDSAEMMIADAVESIRAAGYEPGRDVAIAVDVASSHFFHHGAYHLGAAPLTSEQMIAQLGEWTERFPIVSLEDGLSENDWEHWPRLRQRFGTKVLTLGDDFLCTNPRRIERAIAAQAANALLLKVNQVGTLTEANAARRLAREAGWQVTISARSGETEDDWLADLAVGWNGDQIKIGSITQSERLSKYNRLLEIEAETRLPVIAWP